MPVDPPPGGLSQFRGMLADSLGGDFGGGNSSGGSGDSASVSNGRGGEMTAGVCCFGTAPELGAGGGPG